MWDQRYSDDDYFYGTAPNDFLATNAGRIPNGPVLCLAEGEGRNAVHLAGLGYQVTAVDSSAAGLRKAERLARERGVTLECVHADLADYDLGTARWAGIVSIFAHLPPPLRRQVHAAIPRALRPGGILLLEAYTPAQLDHGTGGPPVAELMMDAASLRDELPGLVFDHLAECEREVVEGKGHRGTGAVVQAIARKPT
ncbi:class I SAM-dependent methyltransferase [endosymbiont of unidentified scaly snail isolate Monju]|uniref:class I SAM-dependent methyltransferase n=1 Tax=endosymbiont of unidentified scaly snail isolate Monju TaxID=1248727 RepID=UPI000389212C|nr:class I SAM-dependent methyltransferase [endosymbiont of unidentified scaly snail isolate Monju]BAN69966.1 methyltransferase type 11 [endosymbiont of unidentified scaly snail isolate Monju]